MGTQCGQNLHLQGLLLLLPQPSQGFLLLVAADLQPAPGTCLWADWVPGPGCTRSKAAPCPRPCQAVGAVQASLCCASWHPCTRPSPRTLCGCPALASDGGELCWGHRALRVPTACIQPGCMQWPAGRASSLGLRAFLQLKNKPNHMLCAQPAQNQV